MGCYKSERTSVISAFMSLFLAPPQKKQNLVSPLTSRLACAQCRVYKVWSV